MIELKNVTKIFNQNRPNEITALKDISFLVKEGDTVLLKGPSGSGKSTILSLIAALSKPTSGEVTVDDTRVSKLPDNFAALFRRKHIGFIFQKFNLIPTLSVFDNVSLPLIPSGLKNAQIAKKAESVMKKFSIDHKANELTKNLSGGEQQRCAIARALINDPDIILADEPTANLDEKLSNSFLEFVKEIKEEGKSVIISTHDPIFFDNPLFTKTVEISKGRLL